MFKSNNCPGIKQFVRPIPEYFNCPSCGGNLEIWSDEDAGVCQNCNREFGRPRENHSCLEWCEFAEKCKEIIRKTKH